MTTLLQIITLTSIVLVIYHHAIYPLLLRLLARLQQPVDENRRHGHDDDSLPDITIVMPAYNEAAYIADKLQNLAILDYPQNKYSVVIACDGCTDGTADIARKVLAESPCRNLRTRIIDYRQNRGKVAVINDVLPQLETGLVVFSDVSALLAINALKSTADAFKDPSLGVLTGCYRLLNPGSAGEQKYWKYQTMIKQAEARLGSTLGVHGAFYAFRHALAETLPGDTINDDFVLPMRIVAQGYRAGYAGNINAVELEQANNDTDQRRRRRIAAGNMQQLWRLKALLHPKYKGVAFMFASGKALRVFMPFLMVVSLAGSMLLAGESILFALLSIAQLVGYFIALLVPERTHKVVKILRYLVIGHMQSMVGVTRYWLGMEKGRWARVNS